MILWFSDFYMSSVKRSISQNFSIVHHTSAHLAPVAFALQHVGIWRLMWHRSVLPLVKGSSHNYYSVPTNSLWELLKEQQAFDTTADSYPKLYHNFICTLLSTGSLLCNAHYCNEYHCNVLFQKTASCGCFTNISLFFQSVVRNTNESYYLCLQRNQHREYKSQKGNSFFREINGELWLCIRVLLASICKCPTKY